MTEHGERCAHLNVGWCEELVGVGPLTRGVWRCRECSMPFFPHSAVSAAEPTAWSVIAKGCRFSYHYKDIAESIRKNFVAEYGLDETSGLIPLYEHPALPYSADDEFDSDAVRAISESIDNVESGRISQKQFVKEVCALYGRLSGVWNCLYDASSRARARRGTKP